MKDDDDTMCYRSELEAAVKAEREAIARSLDKQADLAADEIDRQWAQEMAAAVRARGQDPMPLFDDWGKDWTK